MITLAQKSGGLRRLRGSQRSSDDIKGRWLEDTEPLWYNLCVDQKDIADRHHICWLSCRLPY
jgi:hypothetical protein